MNKKIISYLVFVFIIMSFYVGCVPHPKLTLYWDVSEDRFYTNDVAKAQKEIPFQILVPTYFPENGKNTLKYNIEGPLPQLRDDDKVDVVIMYGFTLKATDPGIFMIDETNYYHSLGDPKFNADLEQIEISGIPVTKTKDNWSTGYNAYYSFNKNGIYYVIESRGLLVNESYKMVESMVNQIAFVDN